MDTLLNPFKRFAQLMRLFLLITGYLLVFIAQVIWYFAHGRRAEIGEAIGHLGRSVVDAIAQAFR